MVSQSFFSLAGEFVNAAVTKAFSRPVTKSIPTYDASLDSGYAPHAFGGYSHNSWDGDKFYGGFGITKDYTVIDHHKLRLRSKQIFTENIYARGLIRRLLTNVIHTGLNLEATPDSNILGLSPDMLGEWSENIERRFKIWSNNPLLCDHRRLDTLGAITRKAEMMAMISGDVLVILRQGRSKLPNIELVDAQHVSNPASDTMHRAVINRGNELIDGVEIDDAGRHVAFFVEQSKGRPHKRIPVRGSRTGRKQAWLHYATERMLHEVRGQSILALMMQSLKEVDRYRDSEQRSAVVNSTIAMWVEKTQDKMGSLPIDSAAVRTDTLTTQNDGEDHKDVEFSSTMPGLIMQRLQTGEKPTSYDTKRPNVNFAIFEAAIINTIAWANEIPPEILSLAFHQNYAAARGAVVEFKIFLDRKRTEIGHNLLSPIYQEVLLSESLNGDISAPGLLEAWRDPNQWDKYGAWVAADWSGAIKPNTDLLKDAKAYKMLIDIGLITHDRACRELTGMKYSKVIQMLKLENQQFVEAMQPLIDAGILMVQQDEAEVPDAPEVNAQ